ncbi:MAG: hypothetical protein MUE50_11900 [Pirellulaceae bacterium]|jgi:hypothetical protein|nr:hypothetical protein [Pirellulaceae bacterium]
MNCHRALVFFLLGMLCASASASEPAAEALSIVAKHKAVFSKPPEKIPSRMHPHDAPILGNGDLAAAMAGGPEYPQFWITTNDFWEFRKPDRGGAPKSLGRLIFEMPSLAGASYRVEQDFATATTAGRFEKEGAAMTLRAWVAATENVLVVELAAEGQPIEVTMSFRFPEQPGLGASPIAWAAKEPYIRKASEPAPVQEQGWANGLLWTMRTFDKSVWQPTRLAMAARVLGTAWADGHVTVTPGKPVTVAVVLRSWEKTTQPLENATRRAERFAADDVHLLRALHEKWWQRYWAKSLLTLDDQAIEQACYRSFYVFASLSRDPHFAANFDGVVTVDSPLWYADYKLDYNHQMAYLGWATAGRFEQADPYVAPLLAQAEIADKVDPQGWPILSLHQVGKGTSGVSRHSAKPGWDEHHSHFFVRQPAGWRLALGVGPKGHVTCSGPYDMKSHNALAIAPVADRWYRTFDDDYALRVYPLVRGVARFWEHDLVLDGGRYVLIDDAVAESGFFADSPCRNNSGGLGVIRGALQTAIDMSESLGLDVPLRAKWREILQRLSDYPIKPANHILVRDVRDPDIPPLRLSDVLPPELGGDRPLLCTEETGNEWFIGFNASLYGAYPMGVVGLDSDPKLLAAAHNTIRARSFLESAAGRKWAEEHKLQNAPVGRGAWNDNNGGALFTVAAIRVGYDPEEIWKQSLKARSPSPSGFIWQGIESLMFYPAVLQEMMLQSHENVLRFFRCWPKRSQPNASFHDLWGHGAFRCSATLRDGVVTEVHIVSEKGRECTVENPWPDKRVRLIRRGQRAEVVAGSRLNIKTTRNETLELKPE